MWRHLGETMLEQTHTVTSQTPLPDINIGTDWDMEKDFLQVQVGCDVKGDGY